MLDVLSDLPLSDEAKGALLGRAGVLGDLLGMTLAYERAEWDLIPYYLDQLTIKHKLAIDVSGISILYRESVEWAHQTFKFAAGDPEPTSDLE
jgi:EAL and modified HD-GYP domain-containing signal transduction protein